MLAPSPVSSSRHNFTIDEIKKATNNGVVPPSCTATAVRKTPQYRLLLLLLLLSSHLTSKHDHDKADATYAYHTDQRPPGKNDRR